MVILITETTFLTRRVGCYRIATILRNLGIKVEIIDFLSYWNIEDLIKLLDNIENIDWIGFSSTYSYFDDGIKNASRITDLNVDDELKLISFLKNKNIPIVIGGSNADSLKNNISGFYVVVGYADNAVSILHNHITKKQVYNFSIVNENNVLYCDNNADLSNIETIFLPNDLIDKNEMLPIEISRGCIFKCKFCEFPLIGKKPGTYIRPKESITRDIEQHYYNYEIKNFLFVDDTFNDSIEKMQIISDIRKDTGIDFEFWSYGRLDLFHAHPKMIDLIENTGWRAVTFGVETLNKKSGSKIGKGGDPQKLKDTLKLLRHRYPTIHIQINLISGLINSTKEDIKESIDWFLDNNIADYIKISPLTIRDSNNILSSSEFGRNPEKFGYNIISTDSLNYYWKNKHWDLSDAKNIADEMTAYIMSNFKHMRSYHYDYYVQLYKNQGMKSEEIRKNILNYPYAYKYIELKKNILSKL